MKIAFALAACVVTLVHSGPPVPPLNDYLPGFLGEHCELPKCPDIPADGEAVTMPYPLDCSLFILCGRFSAHVMACPHGLQFSNESGVCDYREDVDCRPCYQEPQLWIDHGNDPVDIDVATSSESTT